MLIKYKDREKKKIASNSFIFLNKPISEKNSVDIAIINGRFPDEGVAVNKVCQETYFVINGNGKIFIDNEIFELDKNDTFIIEAGKTYSIVGDNLTILCSMSPSWYVEQFEVIK